jgi:hypothetical protein
MSILGRRDRTGDLLDVDEVESTGWRHRCDGGWVDRDADHPAPCLSCKPWLVGRPRPPKPEEIGNTRYDRR